MPSLAAFQFVQLHFYRLLFVLSIPCFTTTTSTSNTTTTTTATAATAATTTTTATTTTAIGLKRIYSAPT